MTDEKSRALVRAEDLKVFSMDDYPLRVADLDDRFWFQFTDLADLAEVGGATGLLWAWMGDMGRMIDVATDGRIMCDVRFVSIGGALEVVFHAAPEDRAALIAFLCDHVLPMLYAERDQMRSLSLKAPETGGKVAKIKEVPNGTKKVCVADRLISFMEGDDGAKSVGDIMKMVNEGNGALVFKEEEQEGALTYRDIIDLSPDPVDTGKLALDYDMSERRMDSILDRLGAQVGTEGAWSLAPAHQGHGYAVRRDVAWTDENGEPQRESRLCFTQKGRRWLYALLKANGYLPLVER